MNYPRENQDCETLAPFVMALFDGEADELEARRARAHLLVCQICARRWLDWNRSRDLLRAVPVPAPPPTLLWRVLMACRLASFARKRRFHLGGSVGLGAAKAEKSGSEFAPRDLSAQILSRTTRAEMSPSRRSKRPLLSIFAVPSLAVPALAIWLFAMQGGAPWFSPSSETPVSRAALQPGAAPRAGAKTLAPSTSRAAPRRAAVAPSRKLVVSPTVSALEPPQPSRAATRAQAPLQPQKREAEAPQAAPQPVVRAAPRVVAVAFSPAPASPRRAVAPRARPVAARRVTPSTARPIAVTPPLSTPPRLATLSTPHAPRLRVARWEISALRLVAGAEKATPDAAPSRVSLPTAPDSAPTPAPPLLLAENFEADDEGVEDEGVEEMRSVVDDFRAALAPDGFQTIDFETDAG